MSTPPVTNNVWDTVYSVLPNCYRLNTKYSTTTAVVSSAVSLAGACIALYVNSERANLAGKALLWIAGGCLVVKGLFKGAEEIQHKIYLKSSRGILATENVKMWSFLAPPRDPQITGVVKSYDQAIDQLKQSFPSAESITSPSKGAVPPTCKAYSQGQLEKECGELMKKSLQIATAVRDDLKTWSDSGRFKEDGTTLKGGALLIVQAGFFPFSTPWLYRGFFLLPKAYRLIFNLDECTNGLKDLKTLAGTKINLNSVCPISSTELSHMEKFEASYPESNKEILSGWKALFFKPGTVQYAWRESYNAVMKEIFDLAGGTDKVQDKRFCNWGSLHTDGAVKFDRRPDSMPT